MRAVVQRVSRAQVSVDETIVGQIGPGLLVLLAVAAADSPADADYLVEKIIGLRIFEDEGGKMNLALDEVAGSVLVVSQFTLYGDTRKGRRPSSTRRPRLRRRVSCTNISRIECSPPACAAKPESFRLPCRWSWSTTGQ